MMTVSLSFRSPLAIKVCVSSAVPIVTNTRHGLVVAQHPGDRGTLLRTPLTRAGCAQLRQQIFLVRGQSWLERLHRDFAQTAEVRALIVWTCIKAWAGIGRL